MGNNGKCQYFALILLFLSSLINAEDWLQGPTRYQYLLLSKHRSSLTRSEAESICREQDGSLPSLTTQEDIDFIRDALGVADYWTSGLPKVVNFQLKQVWPNNAPVKDIQSVDPICRTFLLRCAILVESSNLHSVLREVKKSVNHVCQRRLETENRLIPGPNAIDYLLIDKPMNYAEAVSLCKSNKLSLPKFADRAALGFITGMINHEHTYWTSAELSDDGTSYQWSDDVSIGDILVSEECEHSMDECYVASHTGQLTVFPDNHILSVVICAGHRNKVRYNNEDIPFTVNSMPASMTQDAIAVAQKATKTVQGVPAQVQLITKHFDNSYGQKWYCLIQNELEAKLRTRPRKSDKNFFQFIIDGAVVTLYQSVPRA